MYFRLPKFIGSLGLMRASSTSTYYGYYGVYQCGFCKGEMLALINNVKQGKTVKCDTCRRNHINYENIKRIILSKESFIQKATTIHGNKYEYNNIEYINARTHVNVTCKNHGDWLITPDNLLRGYGCNKCACLNNDSLVRLSLKIPVTLYLIYFNDYNLWKLGCTQRTIKARYSQDKLRYTIIFSKEYQIGGEAYSIEQILIRKLHMYLYKGPNILIGGNSELLIINPLEEIQEFLSKLSV